MPIQFDLSTLFDGVPSDQLRETVDQVNQRLVTREISEREAKQLVATARQTEIVMRYLGIPLESGSAQTTDLEHRRAEMMRQARK